MLGPQSRSGVWQPCADTDARHRVAQACTGVAGARLKDSKTAPMVALVLYASGRATRNNEATQSAGKRSLALLHGHAGSTFSREVGCTTLSQSVTC
ncbi:hypothetical protein MRX96_025008 [Rhipicephalus microplus]